MQPCIICLATHPVLPCFYVFRTQLNAVFIGCSSIRFQQYTFVLLTLHSVVFLLRPCVILSSYGKYYTAQYFTAWQKLLGVTLVRGRGGNLGVVHVARATREIFPVRLAKNHYPYMTFKLFSSRMKNRNRYEV